MDLQRRYPGRKSQETTPNHHEREAHWEIPDNHQTPGAEPGGYPAVTNLLRRITGRDLISDIGARLRERLDKIQIETKITSALSRAAATAATRAIDPRNPVTWEFSGFSQHGEDGILDYLCSKIVSPNRFFFEIGSATGLENCTSWFALARGYAGIMVEGDPESSAVCKRALKDRVANVHAINMFVDSHNIEDLLKLCPFRDPDIFVIDIDGIDYHILKCVIELGFQPKIITVEYNSAFGPERAITVPYRDKFSRREAHPSSLYYGASLSAWARLLTPHGYRFVTVDTTGCNAVFIAPEAFPPEFASAIQGVRFLDNISDDNPATTIQTGADGKQWMPRRDWQTQFKLIETMEFVEV